MAKIFPARKGVFKRSQTRKEVSRPKIARFIILTVVGFLGASLWLASTTSVPEVTRASGELRPIGGYQQVQASEGGIVYGVFVSEGQFVEKDQVLAVLRSNVLSEARRDAQEKIRSSEVETNNLQAILKVLDDNSRPLHDSIKELQADGLDYGASRLNVLAAREAAHAESIAELEGILEVQKHSSALTSNRIEARKVRVGRAEALREKGLITLRDLDDQRDTLDQLRAAQVDVDVRLSQTRKGLIDAKALLAQERLDLRNTLIADVFRLQQNVKALLITDNALAERSKSLEVRAPEAGIMQEVSFPNSGEVIAPGDTIFELLPTQAHLIAEIEFNPVDIGHLENGDEVILKIETYDARRYGQVSGTITSISPNLVFDPEVSREFFRATIELDQTTIGSGIWERDLRAGMAVTAEVVTANRMAIAYLLKPVSRSLGNAFGER